MTTSECPICCGSKRVRLPMTRELSLDEMIGGDSIPDTMPEAWREYDCPECVKLVPFKRVRAVKIIAKVMYDQFGKFQNPIERTLAQQFGAYLQKEGLIKFGADNLDRPDIAGDMIEVSATINIVAPANAVGAPVLEASTEPPPLPKRLTREQQERLKRGVAPGYNADPVAWQPQVFKPPTPPKTKREALQEIRDARAGLDDRFSGIDFGESEFD